MRRALFALFVFATGCGEPSPPADGFALAAEAYRQHFAQGRHEVLLRSSVIIRGDAFLVSLYDGAGGNGMNYLVPRGAQGTAGARVRMAVTPADAPVTDPAVLVTLAEVVSSFEETGAWRVTPHLQDGGASVYVTPQDVLDFAGSRPDARDISFRDELQPIAPAWSYYQLQTPADAG